MQLSPRYFSWYNVTSENSSSFWTTPGIYAGVETNLKMFNGVKMKDPVQNMFPTCGSHLIRPERNLGVFFLGFSAAHRKRSGLWGGGVNTGVAVFIGSVFVARHHKTQPKHIGILYLYDRVTLILAFHKATQS